MQAQDCSVLHQLLLSRCPHQPSSPTRLACVQPTPCSWQLPYTTGNSWQVATHIMAGGRLPIPPAEQLPGPDRLAPAQLDAYVALMERCWQQARDARPSFTQIIADLRWAAGYRAWPCW